MPNASRVGAQLPLGLAAGIPLYLTGQTLSAWLFDHGVDIESIGLFALVALPYNFKFLWAPLFDRFAPPWLGRRFDPRRAWMLGFAVLTAAAIGVMSLFDAATQAGSLAIAALCVAGLSASLDIVVDAYRTEVLRADERGRGASTYVIGYRVGVIASSSGALLLSDVIGWRATYVAMAALGLCAAASVLIAPAPSEHRPPATLTAAVIEPLRELFARPGVAWTLAFVLLFKLGELIAQQLVVPFLGSAGYSNTEIGIMQHAVGMGATIAGVGLGGPLVDRLGLVRALLVFGAMQSLANLGYLLLALSDGPGLIALGVAVVIDNVCNGLGTAALVAFFMALCHRRYSATQYALFTSASSVLGRVFSAASGYLGAALGWAGLFALSIAAALPALAVLVLGRAAIARSVQSAHEQEGPAGSGAGADDRQHPDRATGEGAGSDDPDR
jgi:PAT family beta-lactamase induction signal transducer AmpG